MAELGYDPAAHDAARRLVARRQGQRVKNFTVALLFPRPGVDNTYIHRMTTGAIDELAEAGYSALWVHLNHASPLASPEALPLALRRGEVDGILVCLPNPGLLTLLDTLYRDRGACPIVSLIRESGAIPSVRTDDEAGAYAAMRHLLELGHRQVLQFLLTPHPAHVDKPIDRRLRGVQRALQDAGLSPEEHLHFFPISEAWTNPAFLPDDLAALPPAQAAAHPLVAYLRANPQITALLGFNDANALYAWATLAAAGYRIPEDYSLIGFDDTDPKFGAQGHNLLTSVRLPLVDVGREAVRLLCQLIDGTPDIACQRTLPTELLLRASTASPRPREGA
jgi:DNA-binding LacI/PurR family transcriptional regulator